MDQIVIVDYGMGNIESVKNAFQFLGIKCSVTNSREKLKYADGIVLPGVGAFYAAMKNLHQLGLSDALSEMVINKKIPFFGICLGMQLIAKDSTEKKFAEGLGWIDGHVTKIESNKFCRVPHVGWNEVIYRKDSILFDKVDKNAHFYFDHSYHLQCDSGITSSICDYGKERVTSIEQGNIFAVQFHPEKSQRNGLRIIRNFLNYVARVKRVKN